MFSIKNDDPGKSYGFSSYDKERLEEMINKYDKDMLVTIADLYGAVNGERLNLEGITRAVDALTKYNSKSEFNYLNNLLMPEKCKGVKIPSPIPVPSCSFQLHNCVTLSPNSQGNLGVMFNPFFLASNQWTNNDDNNIDGSTFYDVGGNSYPGDSTVILPKDQPIYSPVLATSLMINNDNSLSGTESNNNWRPVNINQSIPPVYDQYRLVSASVVVKYIGRLDIVSGVIGGAIIFDENPYLNGTIMKKVGDGTSKIADLSVTQNARLDNPHLEKYGNFDLAMDSYYHQENLCLEGIRQLYFPLDNSYEEYAKLLNQTSVEELNISTVYTNAIELDTDNYKSGFNFFIYTLGAPTGACLKLDIYCNYECLPNASFLNYMPVSVSNYSITNQDKKEAISIVQEKPIMKSDESIEVKSPNTMGWKPYMLDMAKRFKTALPSIGKLISMGLNYFIPKLKPAIAVAGTLINSMSQAIPPTTNLAQLPSGQSMNIEESK
jgi:hypothetical protein